MNHIHHKEESHMTEHSHQPQFEFSIGHGIGPVGRWFRLFLGIYFLLLGVLNPLVLNPIPREELATAALQVGGYFLLITIVYFVVFYLLGEFVFARMNPWTGTTVFLGFPALLFFMGVFPQFFGMAFGLYASMSLILIFFMRYGGCEVISLPSLILKKRYTMYCPFNAVDAVERGIFPDNNYDKNKIMSIISLGIVVFVGGYFFLFEMQQLLSQFGIAIDIDNKWALLLLIPVLHLGKKTWDAARESGGSLTLPVRRYGLGSFILFLLTAAFFLDNLSGRVIWQTMMVLGALYVVYEIIRRVMKRNVIDAAPETGRNDGSEIEHAA